MTLEIVAIDPFDDAALAAWHATYFASTTHGREFSTPWMLEEVRALLRSDNPGQDVLGWAGLVDREVVVHGVMNLPLKDNLKQVWLEVNTHPAHREQGHGGAMLEHLVEEGRRRSRSIFATEACYPYDGPADGVGRANVDFLLHRGFTFGLGDVQRVLDLPADQALLEELVAEAAPHHQGYRIRQFRGPVPDDIIDSFGDLIGSLVTEAPMGEMELEREVFDAERIRADEKTFAESGRTKYTTVAISGDGTVAAYTDLVVAEHDPGRVYQWGTLARPEDRGHRLGVAVKAHNLLWLQQERPDLKQLITYNAEVNTYMIAVNDRMGFRPVERLGEFQRKLD
jgi:GNAT superfamily N-acetyltransferase